MNSILSTLGLARRAGKVLLGADSVKSGRGPVPLLVFAADASPRVKRCLSDRTDPSVTLTFTKAELGCAVGCKEVAVLAITDAGFAGILRKKLELQEENE